MAEAPRYDVSVIIASHNRREMLRRCLESLAAQTQDPAVAAATSDVASANRDIAAAIRELAEAVKGVGGSIGKASAAPAATSVEVAPQAK